MIVSSDHVSEKEFLYQFFGNWGRELGSKNREGKGMQWFSDNPNNVFELIDKCKANKRPAYLSVQPRLNHNTILGIEKLFFDFDYAHKNETLNSRQETSRKKKMEIEVRKFLFYIHEKRGFNTLNFKTARGYHIYLFVNKIVQLNMNDFDVWKLTYELLQKDVMKEKYEFCDDMLIGNIKALARIPLSYHEKSGLQIIPVDYKLNPTKIRGLSYYTEFGLKTEDIKNKYIEAKVIAEERKKEIAKDIASYNAKKARGEIKDGEIRPCFKQRLEKGEMPHGMRLACLVEGFHSGIGSIDNQEPLVQLFSTLHDYDGYKLSKKQALHVIKYGGSLTNKTINIHHINVKHYLRRNIV
jgi:hypothetical protein